jgi:flagellar FliL protein
MAEPDTNPVAPDAAPATAEPAAAPAAKSKLPLIAGAVAVLVLAGAGWYFGMHLPAKKQAEQESEQSVEKRLMKQLETKKANKPPVFIAMDEFLVNLPGKGGEHYLQTKLVLRTADNTTEKRITDFLPLVRDRVLAVLSSRTVDEMATVEGKDRMAKDIALVINAIIEPQLTAIFILQQEPSTADLRNLERLGAIPRETAGGGSYSAVAKEAAAQFWKVTEMDLPVQAVLFNALVMQ